MIFKAGEGQSGRDGEEAPNHFLDGVVEHFGSAVAKKGRAEDGDAAYEGREEWGDFFEHNDFTDQSVLTVIPSISRS